MFKPIYCVFLAILVSGLGFSAQPLAAQGINQAAPKIIHWPYTKSKYPQSPRATLLWASLPSGNRRVISRLAAWQSRPNSNQMLDQAFNHKERQAWKSLEYFSHARDDNDWTNYFDVILTKRLSASDLRKVANEKDKALLYVKLPRGGSLDDSQPLPGDVFMLRGTGLSALSADLVWYWNGAFPHIYEKWKTGKYKGCWSTSFFYIRSPELDALSRLQRNSYPPRLNRALIRPFVSELSPGLKKDLAVAIREEKRHRSDFSFFSDGWLRPDLTIRGEGAFARYYWPFDHWDPSDVQLTVLRRRDEDAHVPLYVFIGGAQDYKYQPHWSLFSDFPVGKSGFTKGRETKVADNITMPIKKSIVPHVALKAEITTPSGSAIVIKKRYFEWSDVDYESSRYHEAVARYIIDHLRKHPRSPVVLIGHSYGGDTALDVTDELNNIESDLTVQLVVTLDAVSKFDPDHISGLRSKNIQRWTNVWIEGREDISDWIAIIGGHWDDEVAADRNIKLIAGSNVAGASGRVSHAHTKAMVLKRDANNSSAQDEALRVMSTFVDRTKELKNH